ncbi:hypothetical protein SLE2022_371550 [Rubroshorea leprosula]
MDIAGTMSHPCDDTLREVSRRAQLAKSTSTRKWLRDGFGNYAVEEARQRQARPNMDSPRACDSQKSHKGGKSRDRWAERTHMGANLEGESHKLNSLKFNVEDVIHNVSLRLLASPMEGDIYKKVNDITRAMRLMRLR